jgi:hypothetical protein
MTKRFPDNKPVSITIPAALADALIKHGDRLIDALKHQAVLAEQTNTASRSTFKADSEKRREEHRLIGVQAYRRWRRLDMKMFKTPHFAMVALAEEFDLSKAYLELLISSRRNIVSSYIRHRRSVSVITLYLQGKSNVEIEDAVGVGKTSIGRTITQNKELVERIRWRLRQREARNEAPQG